MRILLYLLFFSLLSPILAQEHETCDGLRYHTEVFTNVNVTEGLQYGTNTTIAGNSKDLFLDIYEPDGDLAASRPTIVLGFGGSFITGNRRDISELCENYARRGFVAVSIDYRLYDLPLFPLPTEAEMTDVVIKTVGDMKAAIRFLREDAATTNTYRIDSELIFVGGISAGAIMASHMAILDSLDEMPTSMREVIAENGGFRGNSSDNYQYSDEIAGLINFSGALSDASLIDANDPPFYSVHDEFDPTVPYGKGMANVLGFDIIYVEGSQAMHEIGDSVGVHNELNTIVGSRDHVGYFTGTDQEAQAVINASSTFLHDLFCDPISTDVAVLVLEGVAVYPNPSDGKLFVSNKGGLNLEMRLFTSVGQQVGHWENVGELDVAVIGAGAYFLEVRDRDSGVRLLEKVVVR